METEPLEARLRFWDYYLALFAGMALVLLALALTNNPDQGILRSNNWNWYLIWALVQLAGLPLLALFLFSRDWKRLPFADRLKRVYAYLAIFWILVTALLIKYSSDESGLLPAGLGGILLLLIYASLPFLLALSYRWLLKTYTHRVEEIFP